MQDQAVCADEGLDQLEVELGRRGQRLGPVCSDRGLAAQHAARLPDDDRDAREDITKSS